MIQQEDYKTIQLFDELPSATPNIEELQKTAIAAIKTVVKNHTTVIAYSAGKDSSIIAHLALTAAAQVAADGGSPLVVLSNADTLSENPEIHALVRNEVRKMASFAKKKGIKFISMISQPSLLSTTQVKILSGRGIPSYAGTSNDCSVSLKINPQRAARNDLFRSLKQEGLLTPCTLLGTRVGESQKRRIAMSLRNDNPETPVENANRELVMCPIAYWATEDVFELLGYISSGLIESFSDFTEVLRVYAHGGGTSCAIVSFDILDGGKKRGKGGCGRFGCWSCLQVEEDKTMATMADYDERYNYMRPLLAFTEMLRNARYDWSLRSWVGRTIRAGHVAIEPDTFSSKFIRAMTRMLLQIDYDERRRAYSVGEAPRFEALPLDQRVVIDYLQSLNGLAPPFSVWADLRDIERGVRYEVWDLPKLGPQPRVEPRFLHVGDDWMIQDGLRGGFRDAYLEALTEDSPCLPNLKRLGPGHYVWDVYTERGLSVDMEAACFIEDEFRDHILQIHDHWKTHPQQISAGFLWYTQLGTPTLDHSSVRAYDLIARRTEAKHALGLTLDYDAEALYRRSIEYRNLPSEARSAWGHKASNLGSQVDIDDLLDEVDSSEECD